MTDEELCRMFGTTLEQVDADAEKYESGDLSGWEFAAPVDGRPRVKMRTASLKMPEFELVAIDRAAKSRGMSRSAFIRQACSNELMESA